MAEGIEALFGDELDAILDQSFARADALSRIRWSFLVGDRREIPRYYGLARMVVRRRDNTPLPWGWTRRRMIDRDAALVMPLWLAWVVALWWHRWWPVDRLIRLGVLSVDEDGYYKNARARCPSWVWCALNDRDTDPRGER